MATSTLPPVLAGETDVERRKRLRTVVAASLLGTTVEWYDFFLYATAASLVFNQLFFPDQSSFVGTLLSFATFAVGFVVRPIGGVVLGHIGDRIGRRPSLTLAVLAASAGSLLIAICSSAYALNLASGAHLPPSRLALDPADVIRLVHDSREIELRLVSIADSDGRGVEAVRQDRAAYDLPPGDPRTGAAQLQKAAERRSRGARESRHGGYL